MDLSVSFSFEELQQLYDKFNRYDKNKDNLLSKAELLHLVQAGIENATEHEVDWFLGMIDIKVQDKDVIKVNFPQYVRGMSEFAKVGTTLVFRSKGDNLAQSLVTSAIMSLNIGTGTKRKGLDWKEVNRVYQQFLHADANNSGTISFAEMAEVFRKVVPTLSETQYSCEFNKIDANRSGYVDFMEFLAWVEHHNVPISLGRTKSTPKLDIDSIGTLSRSRVLKKEKSKKALQTIKLRSRRYSLTQAHPPVAVDKELRADAFKAFAAIDENSDGELSEEEFYHALALVPTVGELPQAEKTRLYSLVDSDMSKAISFDEFLYAVANNVEVSKMASMMKHSYFASKFPWEIPHDELLIEAKIGEGNFGVVNKGKWHGTPVAIKRLKQQALNEEVMEDYKKELAILAKLRHPNIVLLIGASTSPDNLYIVTEYLPEGTVYHLIHKQKPPKKFSTQGVVQLALQVARGMAYLHHNKIIHRDLKSLNLLLDDNYVCKLCDFGLSCLLPREGKVREQVGSPLWMAPEILNDTEYSEKVDQYSFAICLWEVVTNQLPFEELTINQLVRAINAGTRPEIPSTVDPQLASIIKRCWYPDPSKRPPFTEIVEELEKIK
eukprot:Phypoly_transcript_04803.p1 GENE.Phypoly_transcript_04803~~Phypoly_transcript_04803.p1  ORF type:complete len:607 (+),score=85.69 Phypoly_transcript_04803:161-1981(+)